MSEAEWATCSSPYDMLRYLDGKVEDIQFVQFNLACCRRIWSLISDARSRAVVEATEQWLAGNISVETAGRVFEEWYKDYERGVVSDCAGGNTHEAVECLSGGGFGNAAAVAATCFESVGYAASESIRRAGTSQSEITAAWESAASMEKVEQCRIIRGLFVYTAPRP